MFFKRKHFVRCFLFYAGQTKAGYTLSTVKSAKGENREMTRTIRKEMARFAVDCSEVMIGCNHGNITLHGKVRSVKGHEAGFETSIKSLLTALRAQRGVRDVLAEWNLSY